MNAKRVAVMQPYLFPYLGYFQLMAAVDRFVLLDDVHYINRGWINRNRIAVNGQAFTFTAPLVEASQNKRIHDIRLAPDAAWRQKLLKTLEQTYRKAIGFEACFPALRQIVSHDTDDLAAYLRNSLLVLKDLLQLPAEIEPTSARYGNQGLKGEARIIDICRQEHAATYINLAGGVDLYDKAHFAEQGIDLKFLRATLPEYVQGPHAFLPGLSIVDVLMRNTPAQLGAMLQMHDLF